MRSCHVTGIMQHGKGDTAMQVPIPPRRAAPSGRLSAPRSPLPSPVADQLPYRWEQLREDQRQQALGMVAHMQRLRHSRRRMYGRLIVLVIAVIAVGAALMYLAQHGVPL
jgi:hypothetical protein